MSWFAEYIAWGIIVLVQLGLIGGAIFSFGEYSERKNASDASAGQMLGLGIGFSIFALLFLCCLYCGFNSLRIAINVVDASADFLAKTKRLIGVPIMYFFVQMVIFSIWVYCMISINSIGTIEAGTGSIPQAKHMVRTDQQKKVVYGLFAFMLFGLLWIFAFIKANSGFVTMVSATTYYFDSNKEKEGDADVGLGFKFAYMYHAGSLALGSFIIAVIQFIRIVVITAA